MAKSAALGFTLAGVGAVAVISGIQGKSIAEVLKGEIGKAPDPAFAGEGEAPGQSQGTQGAKAEGAYASGLISPFRQGTAINWGRADQGIDGRTPPGTPLLAMGNGTIEIAHDCTGFGCNYVVLHIENDGSFYYGHAEPVGVSNGQKVVKGQVIARTHVAPVWGNSHETGGFEFGKLKSNGEYPSKGEGSKIYSWFQHLPQPFA